MDSKEIVVKELTAILKIDSKYGYGNPQIIPKLIKYVDTNSLNQSSYGQKYEERLKQLADQQEMYSDTFSCIICNGDSKDKMICESCKAKLINNGSNSSTENAARGNAAEAINDKVTKVSNAIKETVLNNPSGESIINTVSTVSKKTVDKITERVNVTLGGSGKVDLKLKDLFSQVLKKHTKEEADELFTCGTQFTTPKPDEISSSWPKPWLFSRVAVALIVTFYILLACYNVFDNQNAIPGIMFIGSLAIPFSMLIFLFEINAPRNISIFRVVLIFMLGGASSLFITLLLYQFNSSVSLTIGGAIFVGIVEELGKIIVLAYMMNKMQTTEYLLNGLLVGGAVGTGFAVFESAGYAFSAYIGVKMYGVFSVQNSSSVDNMVSNILRRGFLSPGGHIAWAAMEGAFLVLVLGGQKFQWKTIISGRYLSLCLIPIIMHALWDMPVFTSSIIGIPVKMAILEILALIIILVILHRGLEQINSLQNNQ